MLESINTKIHIRSCRCSQGQSAALRALSNNPDATNDLVEEQRKIDAEATRLKANASIKKSEDAKKAVDKAAAIAKSIVSALTSAEMRPLWIQLKALLDEIYEAKEDKK